MQSVCSLRRLSSMLFMVCPSPQLEGQTLETRKILQLLFYLVIFLIAHSLLPLVGCVFARYLKGEVGELRGKLTQLGAPCCLYYFLHCIIFSNSSPENIFDVKNNSYSIYASLYLSCSLYLCSLAIFAWSLSRLRLEKADEVLRIFKAEALADLRYAEGFIIKQLAGSRQQSVVNHTLSGFASLCLD